MTRLVPVLLCLALTLAWTAPARAEKPAPPSEIAGIALGADSESLRERLDLSRVAPLWDRPWLTRANLKPTKGFAAGYVVLGGCATSGRVERVRLKYQDGSMALYDKLAKALTARYGKPQVLAGPKTGKYQGLRWVFGADKDHGVDLLLEHQEGGDDEVSSGNVIRLTDNRAMGQERACYDAMLRGHPEPQPAFPLFAIDDAWLLPK